MTMQTESADTPPRQMTCVRRLYVLKDEEGRTWLAAEEATSDFPGEGGAMSHRTASAPDDDADTQGGGAMSHLLPGEAAEVEGDDPDQVTVVVPAKPGLAVHRIQAYRVSPALLPTGAEPTSG